MPLYNIDFSEPEIFPNVNYFRVSQAIFFLTLQSYHKNAGFLSKILSILFPATRPSAGHRAGQYLFFLTLQVYHSKCQILYAFLDIRGINCLALLLAVTIIS